MFQTVLQIWTLVSSKLNFNSFCWGPSAVEEKLMRELGISLKRGCVLQMLFVNSRACVVSDSFTEIEESALKKNPDCLIIRFKEKSVVDMLDVEKELQKIGLKPVMNIAQRRSKTYRINQSRTKLRK